MQEVFYENRFGERVYFSKKPYVYKENSLYSYGYDSDLMKKNQKLSIGIQVWSNSFAEDLTKLSEFFERDTADKKQGKLYFNDSYIPCNITAVKAGDFGRKNCIATLEISATYDYWITEKVKKFYKASESGAGIGFSFPSKFPFKFTRTKKDKSVNNAHYSPSKARLIFYGSAHNPSITIGGNIYRVYTELGENDYLVVDPTDKTVIKYSAGQIINLFDDRDKENDIFKPVPPGESTVDYSGTFAFDVILLQERSLPKWI